MDMVKLLLKKLLGIQILRCIITRLIIFCILEEQQDPNIVYSIFPKVY